MGMNYVDSFDLFGVKARQRPCKPGVGAPTTATEGAVGELYMDTDTGALYKCIAVADGVYTWEKVSATGSINYDKTVKAINHRGGCNIAPENTIPAFILSKQMGFNYVEADVVFTSDFVPVLLHDDTIDRTSNGTGNVWEMTYQDIFQYDFNYLNGKKIQGYDGVKIATFDEFIRCCKNLGLHPYIELKTPKVTYSGEWFAGLVEIVKSCGMQDEVTWISFNHRLLKHIKNADPTARLGYLNTSFDGDDVLRWDYVKEIITDTNEVFMNINTAALTPSVISRCKKEGYPVEAYCPNDTAWIETMDSYISGVTSDTLIAGKVLSENASIYAPAIVYSITNNLVNAVSSNTVAYALNGDSYFAELRPNSGMVLVDVSVNMNGENVTADVYADGVISISNITGNIVVTASASYFNSGTLVNKWDLTESITDTIGNKTFSLIGTTAQTDNGVKMSASGDYAGINLGAITNDLRIEVDVAEMNATFENNAIKRLIGYDNANSSYALVWYGTQGCWAVYNANGYALIMSELTDVNYFSGKTVAIEILTSGIVRIYADGVMLGEVEQAVSNVFIRLSGSGSATYYSATFSGMRVYQLGPQS